MRAQCKERAPSWWTSVPGKFAIQNNLAIGLADSIATDHGVERVFQFAAIVEVHARNEGGREEEIVTYIRTSGLNTSPSHKERTHTYQGRRRNMQICLRHKEEVSISRDRLRLPVGQHCPYNFKMLLGQLCKGKKLYSYL